MLFRSVIAKNISGNDAFLSKLSRRILLTAAEAACHGTNQSEFIALCINCYKNAKSGFENGGNS